MTEEFDKWLEEELDKGFASLAARPVPSEPRFRAITHMARRNPLAIAVNALTTSRTLASVAAALFIGASGTAAAAAATGTNPLVFGQEVSAQVVTCKEQLASGQHSVGECVSAFIQKQHEARSEKAANASASASAAAKAKPNAEASASNRGTAVSAAAKTNSEHGGAVSSIAALAEPGSDHGAAVSAVARSGSDHGEAVSAVAQSNGRADETSSTSSAQPGNAVSEAARAGDTPGASVRAVAKPSVSSTPTAEPRGQAVASAAGGQGRPSR